MLNARSSTANRTTAGRWTVAAALLASTVTLLAACGGSATGGSDTGSSAPESSATTDSGTGSNTPVIRGNAVACTASASQTCAVAGTNAGEVVVSWGTMTPPNNVKYVGYEVKIKSGTGDWAGAGTGCSSGNMESAKNATGCTVTGLAAGTYSFKVAPVGKILGVTATASFVTRSPDVIVAGTPSAPVITAATSTESTTATVTFSAPTETGGSDITGYTVASDSGNITKTATTAGTVTVDGLTAGTSYTFTVTATNAAGFTSDKSAPSGTVTPVKTYAVGDTGPGGGKVFYRATTPFTSAGSACGSSCSYLEVGPRSAATITWCASTTTQVAGTFGTAVGTGYQNTQNMRNSTTTCATGAWQWATTTSGGLSDWYLPSKNELAFIYATRTAVSLVGDQSYWSSSQSYSDTAWYHQFAQSTGYEGMKKQPKYVLPVRAF
ncbi:MAG: fibronectin type III domain-containing protein [Actinobacteria bacterium]|nr:fibronectin type III domain-containing protein [Actinomycetota bacterium]